MWLTFGAAARAKTLVLHRIHSLQVQRMEPQHFSTCRVCDIRIIFFVLHMFETYIHLHTSKSLYNRGAYN